MSVNRFVFNPYFAIDWLSTSFSNTHDSFESHDSSTISIFTKQNSCVSPITVNFQFFKKHMTFVVFGTVFHIVFVGISVLNFSTSLHSYSKERTLCSIYWVFFKSSYSWFDNFTSAFRRIIECLWKNLVFNWKIVRNFLINVIISNGIQPFPVLLPFVKFTLESFVWFIQRVLLKNFPEFRRFFSEF